ncbi:hypothetical protein AVEN_111872-1 [Araneus ventricosus]|uniref:Uncharacterized protein n=1 Tax=Araneus ventricosus TaxID=182803 RepID=A0A4Y2BXU0_ARAVE|nr:hypothetical protein AVEN_111872-1 [Araneus ventricosus]
MRFLNARNMRPCEIHGQICEIYGDTVMSEGMIRSPCLEPIDFHLFLQLKRFLSGQHFDDDEEVKDAVASWLTSQAAIFSDAGIQNLVSRYVKCLNALGDYVEK